MTEKEWQDVVVKLLKLHGWLVFHPFDSRKSEAGFPDLTCVRDGRLLFIELKAMKGQATPEQRAWLTMLEGVKVVDAFVLRPANDLSEFTALIAGEAA